MNYRAFISYSRYADNMLAVALQKSLQRFGIPWYRPSKFQVFLDRVDLAASPALWPSIENSLEASEFFILLASPESAASQWVQREVAFWIEHRSLDTLLIALVRGTLTWDEAKDDFCWERTSALSSILRGRFSMEPQWVDLRDFQGARAPSKGAGFRDAVASLAAPLYGRLKRDLLDEDLAERKKARRILRAAAALFIGLAVFAGGTLHYYQQRRNSDLARHLVSTAEQLLTEDPQNLETATLVTVQAMRLAPTLESEVMLRKLLELLPLPEHTMDGGEQISTVVFSPDSHWIAAGSTDGNTHLWNTSTGDLALQIIGTKGAPVRALAFSPDGRWLVSSSGESAHVMNVVTQAEASSLFQGGTINALAFSPDGRRLVTAGQDGSAIIWAVPEWQKLQRLPHRFPVAISFQQDGRRLATAGTDQIATIWETETGRRLFDLKHEGAVLDVTFSPSGQTVATASQDRTARIWDASNGRQTAALLHPALGPLLPGVELPDKVSSVRFGSTDDTVATASYDVVRIWRKSDSHWSEERKLQHQGRPVTTIAFNPDATLLMSASLTFVNLWQTTDGTEVQRFIHKIGFTRPVFNADGTVLATGGDDKKVRLWKLSAGSAILRMVHRFGKWPDSDVLALALSPNGKELATGTKNGSYHIWDAAGLYPRSRQVDTQSGVRAIAFSPDGRYLATGSRQAQISDLATGSSIVLPHPGSVSALEFSPDKPELATASDDGEVRIWQFSTGRLISELKGKKTLSFSPDGRVLASGGDSLQLWDTQNYTKINTMYDKPVSSVSWSRNSKLIAAKCDEFEVCIFDGNTHSLLRRLTRGTVSILGNGVNLVRFSQDSNLLAVAGPRTVSILDVRTWAVIHQIEADLASALSFSADGRQLFIASGSDVSVYYLWPEDLIGQACARVTTTPKYWPVNASFASPQDPCSGNR
jgi:WD40 repeat protein